MAAARLAGWLASVATVFLSLACTTRQDEWVYVRIEAVPMPLGDPTSLRGPLAGRSSAPSSKVTLPEAPRRVLTLPVSSGKIATVRQKLAELEADALRTLNNQLREAYFNELDQQETERLLALVPLREEARKAAELAIWSAFARYADVKGPALAKLALYAGFPDPGPRPTPPPDVAGRFGAWRTHATQRAEQARSAIKKAESDFRRAVSDALANETTEYDAASVQIRTEMERLRAEADAKALSEAQRLTRGTALEFANLLASVDKLSLPQTRQRTQTVEGVPALPAGPPAIQSLPDSTEHLVGIELQLWASQKGYKLSNRPEKGRDATQEFLEWRRTYRTGR